MIRHGAYFGLTSHYGGHRGNNWASKELNSVDYLCWCLVIGVGVSENREDRAKVRGGTFTQKKAIHEYRPRATRVQQDLFFSKSIPLRPLSTELNPSSHPPTPSRITKPRSYNESVSCLSLLLPPLRLPLPPVSSNHQPPTPPP